MLTTSHPKKKMQRPIPRAPLGAGRQRRREGSCLVATHNDIPKRKKKEVDSPVASTRGENFRQQSSSSLTRPIPKDKVYTIPSGPRAEQNDEGAP